MWKPLPGGLPLVPAMKMGKGINMDKTDTKNVVVDFSPSGSRQLKVKDLKFVIGGMLDSVRMVIVHNGNEIPVTDVRYCPITILRAGRLTALAVG